MSEFTPINIRQLASRVNPLLGKLIPKFMYRHFEKLLHVEEINAFLEKHSHDETQDFLDAAQELIGVDVKFEGRGIEALKEMQGQTVMFASNHPYGGPEAIVLLQTLHMMFPNVKLVAQSFLKFIEPMDGTCVYNKNDVRSLREALDAKDCIQIYPAGFCSRKLDNKEVFDYEWKKGFVKMAKRNNMPIVIIYTDGALSKRIHKWTKFRKIFNIKTTIETMYLVDEMFKLKGKTLRMVVGSTIDPSRLDDSISNAEWADRLRQYCFELRHNPDAVFDPSKPATLTKV